MSALSLHVERDGRRGAPPVMLLHGFTGSTGSWDDLRGALRDEFDLLLVDLPGHGASAAPDDPAEYALPRLADALASVLDEQRVPACAVLGYSMGGRAALRFALRHPRRVTHLVLESTSAGITDASEREARRRSDHELADFIERQGVEAFVDHWERLPMWATQSSLPAGVRARQRLIRLSHTARGLANSLRGAGQGEDEPLGPSVLDLPCAPLVIAGAMDPAYLAHAERIIAPLRTAPGRTWRLAIAPAGHAVHLEAPEFYAREVKSYLASPSLHEHHTAASRHPEPIHVEDDHEVRGHPVREDR